MTEKLMNPEIVVLAAYLIGGDKLRQHTEDIAVEAFKIAPGRFAWRKHSDRIDLRPIHNALSDSRKKVFGQLITGSDEKGWQLTQAGIKFSEENIHKINTIQESGNRVSKEQRRYLKNERERILASDAYHKFEASSVGDITIRDAQSIFRINDYIQGESRIEKVATLVSAFGEDKVLGALVNYCASLIEVKEQS